MNNPTQVLSLRIRIKSVACAPGATQDAAPSHPAPVLFMDGPVAFVDQTEHEERTFMKDGRLLNVLSFSVAVDAPSMMSKRAVAEHVLHAFTFDFPHCAANAFWESIEVNVLP